jgi:Flp pilus assembly secretin CpaC
MKSAFLALALACVLTAAAEARTIRVQADTVAVLNLPAEAGTVYMANPAIADVTTAANRKLFLLGHRSGQSNLVVLDTAGNEILNDLIVVVPAEAHTDTVNRGTAEATLSCAPRCVLVEEIRSGSAGAGGSASTPPQIGPAPGGAMPGGGAPPAAASP